MLSFKMVALIWQYKLKGKTAKNIIQIAEFEFAACDFLSSIYESGCDTLMANKENKSTNYSYI